MIYDSSVLLAVVHEATEKKIPNHKTFLLLLCFVWFFTDSVVAIINLN